MNPVRNARAMEKKSKISNGVKITHSIKEMSDIAKRIRQNGESVGFVPTMGALHEGHLSLIRRAGKENDYVVVSVFVNPAQFAPEEDFRKYPRNLTQDAKLCRKEGVDIIFSPAANKIYPKNYKTYVDVKDLSSRLCAKFRPGHFEGVATIVTKLFNIVNPDIAYFGQKDAQQSIIINKMAQDLNMPVKIKVLPTIRERDGLAMSSRNAYLSKTERKDAVVLYRALMMAKRIIRSGNLVTSKIIQKMHQLINKKKSVRIQYIEIVEPESLMPLDRIKGKALIALAVFINKTRLIDNIIINS